MIYGNLLGFYFKLFLLPMAKSPILARQIGDTIMADYSRFIEINFCEKILIFHLTQIVFF